MLSILSCLKRSSALPHESPCEPCRYYGFDTVRSISACLVVGCHLSIRTSDAASAFLRYNQIAIPLFAAISGFLLSRSVDNETTGTVLRKRVVRLVPVHVIWTVVYLTAFSLTDQFLNTPVGYLQNMSPLFLAKAFLRGCATVHLWFLPSILYSSVVLVLTDHFLPRFKWLYLAVSVFVLFATAFLNNHFANYDMRLFGYLLMGFGLFRLLSETAFSNIGKTTIPLWILSVLSYGWLKGLFAGFYLDYILVLLTVIVFSDKSIPKNRISAFFSSASLMVYLVHLLVACFVALAVKHFCREPVGIFVTLSMWLFIFLFSTVFSFFCRKLINYSRQICRSHYQTSASTKE